MERCDLAPWLAPGDYRGQLFKFRDGKLPDRNRPISRRETWRPHPSHSQSIISILKAAVFLGNSRMAETGTKPSLQFAPLATPLPPKLAAPY